MWKHLWLVWCVVWSEVASGQITHGIAGLQVTRASEWVIDSDASNPAPGWDRDGLPVEMDVRSINSTAANQSVAYTVVFRLLDEFGAVHPLFQADGTTNAAYTHFLVQNAFNLGPNGTTLRTHTAFLKPASRLDALRRYRVEARVFRPRVDPPAATSLSVLRRYYHFINTSPNDLPFNTIVVANNVIVSRRGALATDPEKSGFEATVSYTLRRYDAYNASHIPADDIPIRFTYELQEADTGAVVPIALGVTNILAGVFRHAAAVVGQPTEPYDNDRNQVIILTPDNGVQLDSVNKTYRVVVRIAHQEVPGIQIFRPSNEVETSAQRLLHFNGRLFFGPIETRLTQLNNSPGVIQLVAGQHVRSGIQIPPGSGQVVLVPGWTFGGGPPFDVRLLSNGNALFDDTFLPLGQQPLEAKIENVRVSYSATQLNQQGLASTLKVWLPAGFGYRLSTNTHVLRNSITWAQTPIGLNGRPLDAVFTYKPVGGLQAAEESQPLWFPVSSLSWVVAQGRFNVGSSDIAPEHVRSDEYARLEDVADSLVDADAAVKRSNDGYFERVDTATAPIVLADTNCVGRLTTTIRFNRGSFRSHFPWNTRIAWNVGGENAVISGTMPNADVLSSVASVAVAYSRGCLEGDCPGEAQLATITLEPTNSVLRFTRDGGLAAVGRTTAPARLQMGYIPSLNDYTHEAFLFTEAGFHMPGRILRGRYSDLVPQERAGALLYAGVLASNPKQASSEERRDVEGSAFETRYRQGLADYAGLNFRLRQDAESNGRSILGGTISPQYPLKQNSKYYLRHAGVSGVHQALDGGFPPEMEIYGYDFEFTRFAFNLLDNQLLESEINGLIHVPYPSDFDQQFAGLQFDCLGGLTGVGALEGSGTQTLDYWNNTFTPRSLAFQRNPDQECDPTVGRMVMAVETRIANVEEALTGNLGFLPDGNLMSADDGLEGVDSRLTMPTLVQLPGPTNEIYVVTPVTGAYFNDYRQRPAQPAEEPGWANFAGRMDVSFFPDLEVHVQTSGNGTQPEAFLDMMGGWPLDPDTDSNHGWVNGAGDSYFTDTRFDSSNRGFPPDVSLEGYRSPADSDAFRVRARHRWQNIHTFEFPLDWLRAARMFRSPEPVRRQMIVLETERQVERITPKHTELTFGVQLEVLPQANLANIASQIAQRTGISDALAEAVGVQFTEEIAEGFTRMDELLNSSMETFFDEVFASAIDPSLDDFYDFLAGEFDANNPLAWQADLGGYINTQLVPDLKTGLKGIGGDLDEGIILKLGDYVGKGSTAIAKAGEVVGKVNGKRDKIGPIVEKIIQKLAPQHSASALPERIDAFLERAEPTFEQLEQGCERLSDVLDEIKAHMMDVGNLQNPGGMGLEIKEVLDAANPELDTMALSMGNAIQVYLNEIVSDGDSPFYDYTDQEIRDRMRTEVRSRWLGSAAAADVRQVIKERLYDNDAASREILDSVFSEINRIIRGLVKMSASEAADGFSEMMGATGQNVLSAAVDGYAHINGDSLKELRLDGRFQFKIVKDVDFGAYLRIRELDSEGTRTCNEDLVGATEVVLGAKDVPLSWKKDGLKASIETKFTFGDEGGFGIKGLGGGFQLVGEMEFDEVKMTQLSGAVAFGVGENYLSGGAGFEVSGWEFTGGIFFGKACSLSAIEIWDPAAADAIGTATFTGMYFYVEGWVPLNEILLIKSSCLLKLSGGMGMGRGFFIEGPTILAKIKYGLSGELLCIMNVKGELTGVASMKLFNPLEGAGQDGYASGLLDKVRDGLTLKAIGKFTGSLGWCPLCLEVSKEIGATYKGGKWKLEK